MDLQRVHCKIKQVDSDLTLGQGITIQVRASLIVILARTPKHVLSKYFSRCTLYVCLYLYMQVTGELSTAGRPMRAFVQTFVLAPESPKKYYVRNDFFRYQDDDLVSESETNESPG